MANYKLSNAAKEDLIRIHHFGVEKFGIRQADKYFNSFFDYFEMISNNPFSFEILPVLFSEVIFTKGKVSWLELVTVPVIVI